MNANVLVGYSGHAFVVAEAAASSGIDIDFYTEKKPVIQNPFHYKYLGFEADTDFVGWKEDYAYVLGIGDNVIREKAAKLIKQNGKKLITIIHSSASYSSDVYIGEGTFIARQVAINPLVTIGEGVILNTSSIIEHECHIGNGAHIAPGAVLAGNVQIGERAFIGANAVIKQGVKIGKDVIVGAGAVVLKDVHDGMKVVGNPARIL